MHTASSALLTGVLTHLWPGGHVSDEVSASFEIGCAATQYRSNLSAVDNESPANKDRGEARDRVVVTAQGFCRITRVITTNKAVEQSGFWVCGNSSTHFVTTRRVSLPRRLSAVRLRRRFRRGRVTHTRPVNVRERGKRMRRRRLLGHDVKHDDAAHHEASPIIERWHRQGTASAHMIATSLLWPRSTSRSIASANSSVCM